MRIQTPSIGNVFVYITINASTQTRTRLLEHVQKLSGFAPPPTGAQMRKHMQHANAHPHRQTVVDPIDLQVGMFALRAAVTVPAFIVTTTLKALHNRHT